MKERQILECIEDTAEMEYHRTGDRWWLNLQVEVVRKLNRRRPA